VESCVSQNRILPSIAFSDVNGFWAVKGTGGSAGGGGGPPPGGGGGGGGGGGPWAIKF
jgi:hypothetical protein